MKSTSLIVSGVAIAAGGLSVVIEYRTGSLVGLTVQYIIPVLTGITVGVVGQWISYLFETKLDDRRVETQKRVDNEKRELERMEAEEREHRGRERRHAQEIVVPLFVTTAPGMEVAVTVFTNMEVRAPYFLSHVKNGYESIWEDHLAARLWYGLLSEAQNTAVDDIATAFTKGLSAKGISTQTSVAVDPQYVARLVVATLHHEMRAALDPTAHQPSPQSPMIHQARFNATAIAHSSNKQEVGDVVDALNDVLDQTEFRDRLATLEEVTNGAHSLRRSFENEAGRLARQLRFNSDEPLRGKCATCPGLSEVEQRELERVTPVLSPSTGVTFS